MQSFRPICASIVLALFLGLALSGCSTNSRTNPWMAPSERETLAEKVKTHRNAYLRYSQAEEEARKDGSPEAVEHYARAKAAAKKELDSAEQNLSAYEASKGVKVSKTTP